MRITLKAGSTLKKTQFGEDARNVFTPLKTNLVHYYIKKGGLGLSVCIPIKGRRPYSGPMCTRVQQTKAAKSLAGNQKPDRSTKVKDQAEAHPLYFMPYYFCIEASSPSLEASD